MKEGALFVCKLSSSKIAARASRQRSTHKPFLYALTTTPRMVYVLCGSAHNNGTSNHKNADGLCTRAWTSDYDYVTLNLPHFLVASSERTPHTHIHTRSTYIFKFVRLLLLSLPKWPKDRQQTKKEQREIDCFV